MGQMEKDPQPPRLKSLRHRPSGHFSPPPHPSTSEILHITSTLHKCNTLFHYFFSILMECNMLPPYGTSTMSRTRTNPTLPTIDLALGPDHTQPHSLGLDPSPTSTRLAAPTASTPRAYRTLCLSERISQRPNPTYTNGQELCGCSLSTQYVYPCTYGEPPVAEKHSGPSTASTHPSLSEGLTNARILTPTYTTESSTMTLTGQPTQLSSSLPSSTGTKRLSCPVDTTTQPSLPALESASPATKRRKVTFLTTSTERSEDESSEWSTLTARRSNLVDQPNLQSLSPLSQTTSFPQPITNNTPMPPCRLNPLGLSFNQLIQLEETRERLERTSSEPPYSQGAAPYYRHSFEVTPPASPVHIEFSPSSPETLEPHLLHYLEMGWPQDSFQEAPGQGPVHLPAPPPYSLLPPACGTVPPLNPPYYPQLLLHLHPPLLLPQHHHTENEIGPYNMFLPVQPPAHIGAFIQFDMDEYESDEITSSDSCDSGSTDEENSTADENEDPEEN